MLSETKRAAYLMNFAEIEASFRIEGMDPTGDAIYEEAKALILDGKLTLKQALDFVCEQTVALHAEAIKNASTSH